MFRPKIYAYPQQFSLQVAAPLPPKLEGLGGCPGVNQTNFYKRPMNWFRNDYMNMLDFEKLLLMNL